ncbi:hypothetical protein THARTR1_03655 [Trichoderma harzianum]|uniref:Uncharacterized protein n=1 Tax=Trichoderma harzianum TaxID=5544 RepID=A0A2K0UEC0_TRIHA|nr:hypothetical protein THARTR1_03655 [Trichoderma harzianum]
MIRDCDTLDLLSTLQEIVHSHGDEAAIQKQVSAVIATTHWEIDLGEHPLEI